MISRRGLIGGIGLLLAAPAIVKVENLMKLSVPEPVKVLIAKPVTIGLPGGGGYEVGDFIIFHTFARDSEVSVRGKVVSVESNSITFVKRENGLWA